MSSGSCTPLAGSAGPGHLTPPASGDVRRRQKKKTLGLKGLGEAALPASIRRPSFLFFLMLTIAQTPLPFFAPIRRGSGRCSSCSCTPSFLPMMLAIASERSLVEDCEADG